MIVKELIDELLFLEKYYGPQKIYHESSNNFFHEIKGICLKKSLFFHNYGKDFISLNITGDINNFELFIHNLKLLSIIKGQDCLVCIENINIPVKYVYYDKFKGFVLS